MITIDGTAIEYQAGMTLQDALDLIGRPVNNHTIILVDNRVVSDYRNQVLTDGSEIKLLYLVSGG